MRSMWMLPLFLALAAAPAMAKDQTLIEEEDVWKLYTKFEYKFSELGDEDASLGGLQIGTILNDRLHFGLGYYALVDSIDGPAGGLDAFDFWYAGLNVEYDFAPSYLLHPSIFLFGGGGQLDLESADDTFTFIEPGLNLAVNVSESVEFGIGVSYRATQGADDIAHLEDNDLSAIAGSLYFKFTEF